MKLLKTKKIKKSKRGLTFSDKNLGSVGEKFSYIIDAKTKKIIITRNDETENKGTFSKKKVGKNIVPLVDIRNKKTQIFDGAEYLKVSIYDEQVIIETFEEEKEKSCFLAKAKKRVKTKGKNIVSLQDKILGNYKRKAIYSVAKSELATAVGEQMTLDIFDTMQSKISNLSQDESAQIAKDVPIALQVAEFFCGSGMMTQGFAQAGYELVYALDKDSEAVDTYRFNYGNHVECGDINEFNETKKVDAPIIVGCPPCQGFSGANRHTHFLDNPNNALVKAFIKTIKQSKDCKIFVLENVPQILTAGNGMFKDEILKELSDFEISYGVLNSADYGTPQLRKRAIFIGSKIGKIELPKPTHSPILEKGKSLYRTVKQAFEGITDLLPNQQDYSKAKPETVEKMKFVPQGGNWENIPYEYRNQKMRDGKTQSTVYRRLNENEPSITIVNARKSLITHPTENRILSVRECARLFDLPDTFEFLGKLSSKQQQVANGVPARLAKAIAEEVKNFVMKFNIKNHVKFSF